MAGNNLIGRYFGNMEVKGTRLTELPLSNIKVGVVASPTSSSDSLTNLEDETKRSVWSWCVAIIDLINHVLIIALTVYTLCYSLKTINTSTLHATLCTVGYILLMSEAIVVFAGENILTNRLSYRAKKNIHLSLQILGLICTVAGIVIMSTKKTHAHFTTIHGILGLTSVCLMVPLFFNIFNFRNCIRPIVTKFVHNFLGIACFVIGMVTQCYGYRYFRALNASTKVDVQLICIIVTGVITLLSLRRALPYLFKQFVSLYS